MEDQQRRRAITSTMDALADLRFPLSDNDSSLLWQAASSPARGKYFNPRGGCITNGAAAAYCGLGPCSAASARGYAFFGCTRGKVGRILELDAADEAAEMRTKCTTAWRIVRTARNYLRRTLACWSATRLICPRWTHCKPQAPQLPSYGWRRPSGQPTARRGLPRRSGRWMLSLWSPRPNGHTRGRRRWSNDSPPIQIQTRPPYRWLCERRLQYSASIYLCLCAWVIQACGRTTGSQSATPRMWNVRSSFPCSALRCVCLELVCF